MSPDDLLKLLDLDGQDQSAASEDLALTHPDVQKPKIAPHPTALHLDEWGLRRGVDLLRDSEPLQQSLASVGARQAQEHAAADFHGVAFEVEPLLQEACVDPLRLQFLTQLLDTPEYRELHATTVLNEAASALASTVLAHQYAQLRQERQDDEKHKPERKEGKSTAKDQAFREEIRVLRHVGQAVAEASREVEEAREAVAALGLGPGAPGSNDPRVIAALYRRLRSDPTLRRICALAGRYRRVAQSKQRRKTLHGLDDMVGVVLDGEVGRLLPHELAKLAIPELEDDTLRRLVERQLMCRQYRATEPVANGPIIVVVDESGSMAGDKAHTAKALALALAWIGRQQHRWIALVAYSGGSGERLLSLPPGRWNETALLDWLTDFIGGGSSLDVPIEEMPRYYQQLQAPVGLTDVLVITDALCQIPTDLQASFRAWKQQVQARLVALVIDSSPGDLVAISDEIHRVGSLAVSEEGVERVLSI
jgi:uncharacterized protein with von Willebrand factor type A (vWA) domain